MATVREISAPHWVDWEVEAARKQPQRVKRGELRRRFADRLVIRRELSRKFVSYQGNKAQPGLRWLRYKEGFSCALVRDMLGRAAGAVLDPFAGIGTTPLIASGRGREAAGIEIMPVGVHAARAIALAANDVKTEDIETVGGALIESVRNGPAADSFRFPHVPITSRAFPSKTEDEIAKARRFLAELNDENIRAILDFACMSVLEEASYTRKDGQYLRWDTRCGRELRGGMNKGPIPAFAEALRKRLDEMLEDAPDLKKIYGGKHPRLLQGSALEKLAAVPDRSIGLTVTSPPYANRYDYTRTYALELAWLNFSKADFSEMRQALISATVENRSKANALDWKYPRRDTLNQAKIAFRSQEALHEVLDSLKQRQSELSNPHVIRLVENYFFEMALVVAELARITAPGGLVVMVNDNVQYHGEDVPVDLILSDIAETCGFDCEEISVLPRGKGNASQQMGRFGRRELRKCIYYWRMPR